MNPGPLVFLATFLAIATSWLGFVFVPDLQLGRLDQKANAEGEEAYPVRPNGLAKQGEEVYRANGCFYCHTEQVRPRLETGWPLPSDTNVLSRGFGGDVDRQWGARLGPVQSVAQDYLFADTVMLGSQRVGPDLTNIGLRQTNQVWLYQHLYDPQSLAPKSSMPPYRFLFEKRKLKVGQKASLDALPSDPKEQDYEVIPSSDAKALVAYLLSLHSDGVVFEAPGLPILPKKAPPKGTAPTVTPPAK